MKKELLTIGLSTLALVGCASSPTPTYISSAVYKDYDCNQLEREYQRVQKAITAHDSGGLFKNTGVNVGIAGGRGGIYPTISLGGRLNKGNDAAMSRLLGEKEAVTTAAQAKSCLFIMKVAKTKQNKG